jgi:hypothetical protein
MPLNRLLTIIFIFILDNPAILYYFSNNRIIFYDISIRLLA